MPLTANINLSVPPLPDNQVWFADAASWLNYWKDINVNVVFDGATTVVYNQSPYDGTLNFVRLSIDGVDQDMPSLALHNSLVAAFAALNVDYIALKTALKNAGIITNV
jgi:hypothetical protein